MTGPKAILACKATLVMTGPKAIPAKRVAIPLWLFRRLQNRSLSTFIFVIGKAGSVFLFTSNRNGAGAGWRCLIEAQQEMYKLEVIT